MVLGETPERVTTPPISTPNSNLGISVGEYRSSKLKGRQYTLDRDLCERIVSYNEFMQTNKRVRFICGGKIMFGPGIIFPLIVTFPLITVPSGFHFWLHWNDTPFALNVFTIVLLSLIFICMFLVTFFDPGFIPRGTGKKGDPPNGATVTCATDTDLWKWCGTCKIWRPPRSKHCRTTDACVRYFDHYCPWMGNTIARRNYRPFYFFVIFLIMYCINILGQTVAYLSEEMEPNARTTYHIGLVLFCLAALGFTSLLFYHLTYNIYRGLTTNEAQLRRFDYGNDYGYFGNVPAFLCSVCPSQITN